MNQQITTEKDTPICIREINENIKRVFNNEALTRPLRTLNRNCQFKERYDIACDLKEGDLQKIKKREYRERPGNRERERERHKKWREKNKEHLKAYYKELNARPDVIAKRKEYHSRPDVREKRRKISMEYYKKNKVRLNELRKKRHKEKNEINK